jgi:hypothetical protein
MDWIDSATALISAFVAPYRPAISPRELKCLYLDEPGVATSAAACSSAFFELGRDRLKGDLTGSRGGKRDGSRAALHGNAERQRRNDGQGGEYANSLRSVSWQSKHASQHALWLVRKTPTAGNLGFRSLSRGARVAPSRDCADCCCDYATDRISPNPGSAHWSESRCSIRDGGPRTSHALEERWAACAKADPPSGCLWPTLTRVSCRNRGSDLGCRHELHRCSHFDLRRHLFRAIFQCRGSMAGEKVWRVSPAGGNTNLLALRQRCRWRAKATAHSSAGDLVLDLGEAPLSFTRRGLPTTTIRKTFPQGVPHAGDASDQDSDRQSIQG